VNTAQLISITLVVIAVLALVAWATRRYRSLAADPTTTLEPIDLAAFSRLLDESDEEFIRRRLAPKDYKAARRKRIVAAIDYLSRARLNARVMLRTGERAIRSGDLTLRDDAQRLAQLAMQIRQQTTTAMLRLNVALIFPSITLNSSSVLATYIELRRTAESIQQMQPSFFVENG